jgi:circadian clock protein KaiC
MLDLRVTKQIATRRLRVVKYRGSRHESNEYPFLVDELGFSVLPVTSLRLDFGVTAARVSTGVPRLDEMLGGQGYFRGGSVLVTGSAGTGKSTLASAFADATCRRGERCLFFAFEESPQQIARNMRSVGIDLERWVKKGLLEFIASRPTLYGLEMHLVTILKAIERIDPNAIILDPITNFLHIGAEREVGGMLMRLVGFAKQRGITSLFTSLISGNRDQENSQVGVSSLMDTWLHVRDVETNGERTRGLYVLKSRGMAHSNQVREFVLSDRGLELVDVYIGTGQVLTGTARLGQEAKDKVEALARQQEVERLQWELEQKRKETELQISLLRSDLAAREHELVKRIRDSGQHQEELKRGQRALTALRSGKTPSATANRGRRLR